MTREELDSLSFNGTIADGGSEMLELTTTRADDILILVDDGTTDNQPAQYTMTQRVYTSEADDYQFYDEVASSTSRSFADPAWGERMRVEFVNGSGSDATYRITIKVYRNMD